LTGGARDVKIIGFFHPFCDAGGGGEKVLFQAIRAIEKQNKSKAYEILVYSSSSKSKVEIFTQVKDRFGIECDHTKVRMVHLAKAGSMRPELYPSFTLLWQIIAYF